MWELDQPHYLHAHGRSLLGHETDADQVVEIAAVREYFAHAARYEND